MTTVIRLLNEPDRGVDRCCSVEKSGSGKIYYSAIGVAKTRKQWDAQSIEDYKWIGCPRPAHWWDIYTKQLVLSPVPPEKRVNKLYDTPTFRSTGLFQEKIKPALRVPKDVTKIKGFVPDKRALKQIDKIIGIKEQKELIQKEIVNLLEAEELTVKEISDKFTVSKAYIYVVKNKFNVEYFNRETVTPKSYTKRAYKPRKSNVKGDNNPNSRLSASNVIEIRRLYKTGLYTQKQIAAEFNVKHVTISDIVTKKRWKEVQ